MKCGLSTKQAKEHACFVGKIMLGFTVEEEHSIVLCEQGKEDYYRKKKSGHTKREGHRWTGDA